MKDHALYFFPPVSKRDDGDAALALLIFLSFFRWHFHLKILSV
jgi:hypothetical protein